jgi:hypothetical protein
VRLGWGLAALVAVGCGRTGLDTADGGDPSGDAGCHAEPPAPNGTSQPAGGEWVAFAIRTLWLGDVDRGGSANSQAWTQFGFDIDGLDTTSASTNVCKLLPGSPIATQTDGECGIDNSFGENWLPIFLTLFGTSVSSQVNAGIAAGGATDILVLQLPASGDSSNVQGVWLNGAVLGHSPKWDGTDVWPIDSSSVANGDWMQANVRFDDGYVVNGTYVSVPRSGPGAITIGGLAETPSLEPWHVPITQVQVSVHIAPDGMSATGGVLSAIMPASQIYSQFASLCCDTGGFCSIPIQLEQAADILVDGTNRQGVTCNGISLGIGFEATRVVLGPVVTVPVSSPCGDGGIGEGT